MPNSRDAAGAALYLAWNITTTERENLRDALHRGEKRRLFRVRAWSVAGNQARVLLAPEAPLEEIVKVLWVGDSEPTAGRWVRRGAACAELTRQMEAAPVP